MFTGDRHGRLSSTAEKTEVPESGKYPILDNIYC